MSSWKILVETQGEKKLLENSRNDSQEDPPGDLRMNFCINSVWTSEETLCGTVGRISVWTSDEKEEEESPYELLKKPSEELLEELEDFFIRTQNGSIKEF